MPHLFIICPCGENSSGYKTFVYNLSQFKPDKQPDSGNFERFRWEPTYETVLVFEARKSKMFLKWEVIVCYELLDNQYVLFTLSKTMVINKVMKHTQFMFCWNDFPLKTEYLTENNERKY